MQSWHNTYLGLHELPRDISTFELQTFFTYRGSERKLIEARRGNALKSRFGALKRELKSQQESQWNHGLTQPPPRQC